MQAFCEEAQRSHHSCMFLVESRPMMTRERAIPVHEPVCSPGPPAAGPGVAMFASVTQVAMETMIPRTSSVMAPDLAELLRRGLIFRVGGGGRGGPGRSERQGRFPCRGSGTRFGVHAAESAARGRSARAAQGCGSEAVGRGRGPPNP